MILLLGAGFAKDYGLPLTADLLSMFREEFGNDDTLGPRLIPTLDYLTQLGKTANPNGRENIESILHAAWALQNIDPVIATSYGRDPEGVPTNDELESLELTMRQFIRRKCRLQGQLPPWMKSLVPLFKSQRVDIFTTNYDAGLDVFCEQHDISLFDGFTPKWNPNDLTNHSEFGAYVYRLHGSLHWYMPEGDDRPMKLPAYAAEGEPFSYHDGRVLHNEPMIYPAATKDTSAQPFATLTEMFRQRLRGSGENTLISIGYSFADAYLRRILAEEMQANPQLHCIVVAPEPWRIMGQPDVQQDFGPLAHRFGVIAKSAAGLASALHTTPPSLNIQTALHSEDSYTTNGGSAALDTAVGYWAKAEMWHHLSWFAKARLMTTDDSWWDTRWDLYGYQWESIGRAVGWQSWGMLDKSRAALLENAALFELLPNKTRQALMPTLFAGVIEKEFKGFDDVVGRQLTNWSNDLLNADHAVAYRATRVTAAGNMWSWFVNQLPFAVPDSNYDLASWMLGASSAALPTTTLTVGARILQDWVGDPSIPGLVAITDLYSRILATPEHGVVPRVVATDFPDLKWPFLQNWLLATFADFQPSPGEDTAP